MSIVEISVKQLGQSLHEHPERALSMVGITALFVFQAFCIMNQASEHGLKPSIDFTGNSQPSCTDKNLLPSATVFLAETCPSNSR
jgi:hypothetical protein